MKDFNKEYIVQTIIAASNNLRLNSDKIECISILKGFLLDESEIESKINYWKKITELSKFAIRLSEINNFLSNNKIDFLTLSENFKNHSHQLITYISNVLDNMTTEKIQQICNNFYESKKPAADVNDFNNGLTPNSTSKDANLADFDDTNKMKEEIIFNDLTKDDDLDFESFQRRILKSVKSIEGLLQRMKAGNYTDEEILSYYEIMNEHSELSKNIGSLIITEMHDTLSNTFKLLSDKKINPDEYIIECLRACLIVIVATIKNKNVDITNYLNLAEEFSAKIKNLIEEK